MKTNRRQTALIYALAAVLTVTGLSLRLAVWLAEDNAVEAGVRAGLASELKCNPDTIKLDLWESRVKGEWYGSAVIINREGNRERFRIRARQYPDGYIEYSWHLPNERGF